MKSTMRTLKNIHLLKITLLAAFDGDREDAGFEALADAAADMLRDEALTVSSEVESVERELLDPDVVGGDDELSEALDAQYPSDGLTVGRLAGVQVAGRNGTFRHARLERNGTSISLWLGTPKEQYPLVTFDAAGDGIGRYPVPRGRQRRPGVEFGCGKASCTDCYEPEAQQ